MTPEMQRYEHRLTLSLGALFAFLSLGAFGLAQWVIEQGWGVAG
jgi:hypothetical protein